jgi:PAS domain S-box-containing protein
MAWDLPLVVWGLPAGVVSIANEAAADLFGVPLDNLVGSKAGELAPPHQGAEMTAAGFSSGAIDAVRLERPIRGPGGRLVPARLWSRAVEMNGRRAAISLIVPVADVGRLGRDPAAAWRELAPVVVVIADREWRIEHVSTDIRDVLGTEPSTLLGSVMLDVVHPDDVAALLRIANSTARAAGSDRPVRLRHQDGSWVEVRLLVGRASTDGPSRMEVALIGTPDQTARLPSERVAELELCLHRIAAEVRAAGVLDGVDRLPAVSEHHQLGELTSRQWEVLSRLLRGDRVATIAAALYVNPSTVRNHLAAIYRKFGVHSQIELVDVLRRRT